MKGSEKRNVAIVYSGGDDVFLVGSWNDVIMTFMDLRENFRRYTQGTLSISGGVGLFPAKSPVDILAKDVEAMESAAKEMPGKDAITLFGDMTFKWADFINYVIGEKFKRIQSYMETSEDKGNSFLYRLLELFRDSDEIINKARLVYYLARLEPVQNAPAEVKASFRTFSGSMYEWYQNEKERRETIAAIYLYVYLHRETEVTE